MAKNGQSWGRYQGSIGTVTRSEPSRYGQGRQGIAENDSATKKEGTLGTTVSKAGSNMVSDARGRGVRNFPYPEYIK